MRQGFLRGGRWTAVAVGVVVVALSGCGGDDDQPSRSAATNTPRSTATPATAFTGDFAATVGLDNGQTGALALNVQTDGDATGTLTIAGGTAALSRFAPAVSLPVVVTVSGSVNLSTGTFSLTGSYTDDEGHSVSVSINGTLPGPSGGSGSITVVGGEHSFSGTIAAGTLPTPTTTSTITKTATRTLAPGEATSTPTQTPTGTATPAVTDTPISGGATPTPTSGVVPPGISTQMLGTFSGEAKNETVGVTKNVSIRIAVIGGVVVVTDLGGNLFTNGASINPMVIDPTHLTSIRTIGGFPNGTVETLQLATIGGSGVAGIYSTVALTNPTDTSHALALVHHRAS